MHELEKKMRYLPKLMYEKNNEELMVLNNQSDKGFQKNISKRTINDFYDLLNMYKENSQKDDTEYNKKLCSLYKKILNAVDNYAISVDDSKDKIAKLGSDDIDYLTKQVDMYLYIRNIFSEYGNNLDSI